MSVEQKIKNSLKSTASATENVKDKAYETIDQAGDFAKDTVDELEWKAKDAVARAEDAGHHINDKVAHLFSKTKEQVRKAEQVASQKLGQVEGQIKRKPLASTAIAFGAGLLVASLFGASNKYKK